MRERVWEDEFVCRGVFNDDKFAHSDADEVTWARKVEIPLKEIVSVFELLLSRKGTVRHSRMTSEDLEPDVKRCPNLRKVDALNRA